MKLTVTSPSFSEGDWIPTRNTARGEDLSPEFVLKGITPEAKTMVITLDDASHPLFKNYNHWVIWNLPIQTRIPEGIPKGKDLPELGGAKQGIAYGKHSYRGPKPPFNWTHTYVFTFYILDTKLDLEAESTKAEVLKAISGHVLQEASLSGKFQSHRV